MSSVEDWAWIGKPKKHVKLETIIFEQLEFLGRTLRHNIKIEGSVLHSLSFSNTIR